MIAVTSKHNNKDSDHGAEDAETEDGIEQVKLALEQEVWSILKEKSQYDKGIEYSISTHKNESPFLFYIDHCFAIKGQGTILTGTVAQGSVSVNGIIELPALKQQKKIKSMQMFRKPIHSAHTGDRLGICVTQFDASCIERGLACSPGSVPTFSAAIAMVEKVRFYAGDVLSNSKMHVIIGHHTTMAKMMFFGIPRDGKNSTIVADMVEKLNMNHSRKKSQVFDYSKEYLYQDALYGEEGRPRDAEHALEDSNEMRHKGFQWAYIVFDTPITAPSNAVIIGARLDADLNTSSCRIAFHGRLCSLIDPSDQQSIHGLRVYKVKGRDGIIERIENDGCTAICRGMFSKDSDLTKFIGMTVIGPQNEIGILECKFGKSGKFKVRFSTALGIDSAGTSITLMYKRFIFDSDKKKITQ